MFRRLLEHIDNILLSDEEIIYQYATDYYTYLAVAWIALFALTSILSGLIKGYYTGVNNTRIAIAFGCLYNIGEGWINYLPRFFTCALLHYSIKHIFMNITGSFSSLQALISLGIVPEFALFTIPIIFLGSLVGSIYSYAKHLHNSTYTIGASGGGCAISAFLLCVVFFGRNITQSSAIGSSAIISLLNLIYSCTPFSSIFEQQKIDYYSHFGGALTGSVLFLICIKLYYSIDIINFGRIAIILTYISYLVYALCFIFIIRKFKENFNDVNKKLMIEYFHFNCLKVNDKFRKQQISDHLSIGEEILLQEKYIDKMHEFYQQPYSKFMQPIIKKYHEFKYDDKSTRTNRYQRRKSI